MGCVSASIHEFENRITHTNTLIKSTVENLGSTNERNPRRSFAIVILRTICIPAWLGVEIRAHDFYTLEHWAGCSGFVETGQLD